MPTSIEEVELKGEGGLRRAFLMRTVLSIVGMGIVFLCASLAIYSRALQKEMRGDLTHISHMILTYYDDMFPGDYNLLIDENNELTFLKKGDVVISEDTAFVEDVAGETNSEISIFFYDTRQITTIRDGEGNPPLNTIANNKITTAVLINGRESFFNDVEIAKVRYCVQYTPIFASGGTCVGMIGVGRPYSETFGYVYRLSAVYAAIIVIAGGLVGLWMALYTSQLVKHLDRLKDFLGAIAGGHLDGDLDQGVLDRQDEVGDMGRCALFVRGSLKKLVERDPLTNLNNRRSGQIKFEQIRRTARKYGQTYCIAMGDIDFFKKVNDTYGHDAGDAVLKEVARILSDRMAGKGTVIRWGGEEFLFVIEEMSLPDARDFLWNILYAIRDTSVEFGDKVIKFTMSYGIVEGNTAISADSEITAADELLYYAKEHGRNRVCSEKSEVNYEPGAPISAVDMLTAGMTAEAGGAPVSAVDMLTAVAAAEESSHPEESTREESAEPEAASSEDSTDPGSDSSEETADDAKTADETHGPADKEDELWDIYDVNKQLTGRTMKRNDFTMADGDYHLTVLGVVVNTAGEFLLTRRVMSKSWAPGWWEVSGGGVMAGETSEQAVIREIREETGLDVTGAEGGYLFSYRRDNPDEGDNYFVDVYRFILDFTDEQVHIQTDEADGYMLASHKDIKDLGADGVFLHYDSIKEVFEL